MRIFRCDGQLTTGIKDNGFRWFLQRTCTCSIHPLEQILMDLAAAADTNNRSFAR